MGKYSITSSESQYKKLESSKILFGKEERETNKLAEDSSRTCSSEGGRWNCTRRNRGPEGFCRVVKSSYFRGPKLLRTFFVVVLLAMTLCGITIASPTPSLDNGQEKSVETVEVDYHHGFENLDDYDYSNEDSSVPSELDHQELDKIRKTIMEDLGLRKIPDPAKANVSQTEYEKAHREYLKRVELSKGEDQRTRRRLHVFYPADSVIAWDSSSTNLTDTKTTHSIYFPVEIPEENHAVDHATLRILIGNDNDHLVEDFVDVSVYQLTRSSPMRLIAEQRVSISPSSPRWAEFDSTEAVTSWFHEGEENLGLHVEIKRHGVPVRWKKPGPSALNVFTISDARPGARNRRATPDQLMSLHRGRRTECRGQNKKCCRHQMTVIFKDLKGFEFIIQPKDFDAGYCKGRCPPRYNPAHHHALLQSLIWKEDRKKAPRPCCAPSKLTELEILYFDENDATKLKVSNWKNMKVLECACS